MSTVSKRRLDSLIPMAIKVIKEMKGFFSIEMEGDKKVITDKISKTFHGYFSSLGADMINSTPLAAIIFYEEGKKANDEGGSGSKEDRSLIPESILKLLRLELTSSIVKESYQKLSDYYVLSNESKSRKNLNIAAAAAALKIALRTFPKS